MSHPEAAVPTTTRWAIAIAATVGAIALAVHEPLVIGGVLLGVGLAAALGSFAGSNRRVLIASALLPIVVLCSVAVVALAGASGAALVTILGAIIALFACGVVLGQPRPSALSRLVTATLCSSILAGGATLLAVGIDATGGLRSTLAATLWLTGRGMSGAILAVVVAALAAVVALFLVPPAAVTTPSRRSAYADTRNALAIGVGVTTTLAVVGLAILLGLSWYVPLLEAVVDAIAGSGVVRGLLATVTTVALALAAVATAVRGSWVQTASRRNVAVAIVAGTVPGVAVPFGATIGHGGAETTLVATFFGATAVVLGIGWLIAWLYEGLVTSGDIDRLQPAIVLAGALAAGGLVTGASAEPATLGLETVRAGTATFGSLAAALFTYDLGRYGHTLAREIGPSASPRPQLVRVGWSGAVAAVGVPIAALGVAGAALLAPTLSIPATAGVVAALGAIVAGTWLLAR
ncbi:hypothetical protein [Natrinema longum]|uniref:Uncharacterized protein n=1 Tax=Natrinema longum TaxID=370324 RepID=A0A8A2UAQ8_9EURY|nr:hypothetical protein [Natrinema longum]MBZ6493651.1 hypothetical protein [Natrinema longum]QSW85008.1 hypothetical protein J0X27_16410 [Natrinema longum]